MYSPLRFGPAFSAMALASVLAGCAAPQLGARPASHFGGKAGKSNIGLATRALAALNAKDYATAVSFGERAVENGPSDAGFRALLGNAYFASGRFASAEAAYRDALSLYPQQPPVVLKLALVQIAQGRNAEALSFLSRSQGMLYAADYGLAVALAGQPQEAVHILEAAARGAGADARLRQNLALAHALSGDWTAARTVAAQDLSADLVDARIQQWMSFAKPARASDQVAALTGVTPVSDPGQPTRLALRPAPTRTAQAAPVVEQKPVAAFVPQQETVAAFVPQPQPIAVAPQPAEAFEPQFDQLAASPAPEPAPAPVVQAPQSVPEAAANVIAAVAAVVAEAPAALAEMVGITHKAEPKKAKAAPVRRASLQRAKGNSTAVVQIGAYGSPKRVEAAWNIAAHRYSALRAYTPMSARFNSSKGLVYRLSVKGFASAAEAKDLCVSLRRAGGNCFVRDVAGDAPVRMASR